MVIRKGKNKIAGGVLRWLIIGTTLTSLLIVVNAAELNLSQSVMIRVKTATHGDGTIKLLDLENEYLPVVVGNENPNAPYESLKAQVIASRTFALYKINYEPRSAKFDVYDDERDQVYNPAKFKAFPKSKQEEIKQAVKETKEIILKWKGVIICAFFVSGTGNTARYVTYNERKTEDDIIQTRLGRVTNPPSLNPHNRGCLGQVLANELAAKGYNYQQILRYFYGADIEGLPKIGSIELFYDDGSAEGRGVGGTDSKTRHMKVVLFHSPFEITKLSEVKFYLDEKVKSSDTINGKSFYREENALGYPCKIHVMDSKRNDIFVLEVTPNYAGWFRVDLSPYSFAVPKDFYVGIEVYHSVPYKVENATNDYCYVYVPVLGMDNNKPDGKSWWGQMLPPGEPYWTFDQHWDYLIRVVVNSTKKE